VVDGVKAIFDSESLRLLAIGIWNVYFDIITWRTSVHSGDNFIEMQAHQRPLLIAKNDQGDFSTG